MLAPFHLPAWSLRVTDCSVSCNRASPLCLPHSIGRDRGHFLEELGEFLRGQRGNLGLGLREAAKRIGISHQRLIEIERGTSYSTGKTTLPRREVVKAIATAYGLSEPLLLTLAGYAGADLSTLSVDHREVLMLFDALPADRKLLAIATLRAFTSVARDNPGTKVVEDHPSSCDD